MMNGLSRGMGLEQERPVNPEKGYSGPPKVDAYFDHNSIDIPARVRETLEKNHSEVIGLLTLNLKRGKSAGFRTNRTEELITEFELRYSLASAYGVDIISDFLAKNQKKYSSAGSFDRDIDYCLGKIYGSPQNDSGLFRKIFGEIGFRPDTEVGRAILKSLGVSTDEPDWKKSVNACDMRDLQKEMMGYSKSDGYENICRAVFQEFPEQIKAYLAEGDLSGIREVIKGMIEPKFKETYEKVTADTPERRKERVLYVLIENSQSGYSSDALRELIRKHQGISHLQDVFSSIRATSGPGKGHKLMEKLQSPEHHKKTMETFLEKYGEGLVTKVGANYEIANPQEFKEMVQRQYDEELDEAIRQFVAEGGDQKTTDIADME